MNRLDYRPDVDGLRALAVLSVVWYHFVPNTTLSGGFVGVDIFFVISGYLITTQLLGQLKAGELDLPLFYAKRIRRIFPALLFVVMTCLLVGGLLLSPGEWVGLAQSAMAAVFGVSNIFFWQEYGSYFGGDAKSNALLHTWSLGVEEQFYLLWPLALWLLIRWPPRLLGWLLLSGFVLALFFSQWAASRYVSASYYLLPTRAFELLLGACVAWFVPYWVSRPLPVWGVNALAMLGLSAIATAMVVLDASSAFPGWNAALPTLGAAFLIMAGAAQPHFAYRLLASAPMVYVGLLSYSLYLWHWPIGVWFKHMGLSLNGWWLGLALGLSWLMAEISLRWVERPARKAGLGQSAKATLLNRFAPALAVMLLAGASVVFWGGWPQRFDPQVAEFEQALAQRPDELRAGCHVHNANYSTLPNPQACQLGESSLREPDGVLWGDSFANHFSGMVDVMAAAQKSTWMDYTMDACPPLLGYETDLPAIYAQRCTLRNQQFMTFLERSGIKRVVLASQWPSGAAAGMAFESTLDALLGLGVEVTVIAQNAPIRSAPQCSIHQAMRQDTSDCSVGLQPQPPYVVDASARPRVRVIDPNTVICENSLCSPVQEGFLLYRDSGHLNDVGSRWVGQSLLRAGVAL